IPVNNALQNLRAMCIWIKTNSLEVNLFRTCLAKPFRQVAGRPILSEPHEASPKGERRVAARGLQDGRCRPRAPTRRLCRSLRIERSPTPPFKLDPAVV